MKAKLITCSRCEEEKPTDQFKTRSTRCNKCRAEANALNIAHWRQVQEEKKEAEKFNELMSKWIPTSRVNGHGTG